MKRIACGVEQCAPARACIGRPTSGPLLLPNGGFETWRTPRASWRQDPPWTYAVQVALDPMRWSMCGEGLKGGGQWGSGGAVLLHPGLTPGFHS